MSHTALFLSLSVPRSLAGRRIAQKSSGVPGVPPSFRRSAGRPVGGIGMRWSSLSSQTAQLEMYSVEGPKLPFDQRKTMAYRNLTVTMVKPGVNQLKAPKEKDLETQAAFQTMTPMSTLGERRGKEKKRQKETELLKPLWILNTLCNCHPLSQAEGTETRASQSGWSGSRAGSTNWSGSSMQNTFRLFLIAVLRAKVCLKHPNDMRCSCWS